MEELEKLKKEKVMRHKRKENLLKDVETLRKQQGISLLVQNGSVFFIICKGSLYYTVFF